MTGFGKAFKCHQLWPCAFGSASEAGVLLSVVGTSVLTTIVNRGSFLCEPGCTISELSDRISLKRAVHTLTIDGASPPQDTPRWSLVDEVAQLSFNLVGPLVPVESGE